MKKYEVIATTFLRAGVIGLTAAQAVPRAHNLKEIARGKDGSGIFEVVNEVCFKAGEQIYFDGELSKALATQLVTPEELAAREAAEAKAKAEAEAAAEPKRGRGRPPKNAQQGDGAQDSENAAGEGQ